MNYPLFLLLCFPAAVFAGSRTSSSYTIVSDITDDGGQAASSADYTNNGSTGEAGGAALLPASAGTVRAGYAGQLFEATGFSLTAAAPSLNEGATVPLTGWETLDDNTVFAVPPAAITWSVLQGPLSINNAGIAAAGPVYQNTGAVAGGLYAGHTGTLNLTVLNVSPDNFGGFAGDGLDDDWQVQYFGLPPNQRAAPSADPDGDGRSNLFEFLSGFAPTDPASFLQFVIEGFSNANVVNLRVNKVIPGRTYTVKIASDLQSVPQPAGAPVSVTSEQTNYLFQDPAAGGLRKFYFLEVTRP